MAQFSIAQGLIDQAFSNSMQSATPDPMKLPGLTLAPQNNPDATNPPPDAGVPSNQPNFAKDFFGVNDPSEILEPKGTVPGNPSKVYYKFAGDGKLYSAKADTPLQTVLERIWDKKSPSLWQSAKGEAMYGLPSSMASAVAYGLDGLGADQMSDQWKGYSDKLREEFEQKYGQHMVPSFDAALDHGKLWDFALENMGMAAPYMGLAMSGGAAGGLAMGGMEGLMNGTAAARLGSFFGSTAITSPVTIAQFADRQVAQLREAGVQDPESHIDWTKAAVYGTAAAGLQSLPIESIVLGKGVLGGLSKWGLKPGSKASGRILGAIADVAGTNALAMGGTSFLSRANADMPLLDDDAKHEYLTSAITGSLVGIPFGIYKGIRARHEPARVKPSDDNGSVDDVIARNAASETPPPPAAPDAPGTPPAAPGTPPPHTPPPKHIMFFDDAHTYGINDIYDAQGYMDAIHFKDEQGRPTTGMKEFVRQQNANGNRNYTDAELITAARKAKRARDMNDHVLKTSDGIVYRTMDDLPQNHSNAPEIVSKAAELTDRWGLPDSQVRQWSDAMVNKMHEVYFKRDLAKAAKAANIKDPEILGKALKEAQKATNEKAIEDVETYGSLYKRPEAIAREQKLLEERTRNVQRNPRAELAESLMRLRKTQAEAKIQTAAEGTTDPTAMRTPTYTSKFVEEPPVDGEAFGPYAGMKTDPFGPIALLTYQPFGANSTKDMVAAINEGANRPGPNVNSRVAKKDLLRAALRSPIYKEWFKNDPDVLKILADKKKMTPAKFLETYGKDPIEKTLMGKLIKIEAAKKRAERAAETPKEKPTKENTKGQFRYTPEPKSAKPKVFKLPDLDADAEEHLKTIRNHLDEMSQAANREAFKDNPGMHAALNDIFKNFAELRGKVEMPESGFSQAVRGSENLLSSLARRTKVLDIVEKVFSHFNAKGGEHFRELMDKAIGGQALNEKERGAVTTLIHTAFALGKDGLEEGKSLNPTGISELYTTLRNASDSSTKQKLLEAQKFLAAWHKDAKGINPADLEGFTPADVEANAFYEYLNGTLKVNTKGFNKLKISKFFEANEKALKRIRKELNDMGIMAPSDLFQYNKTTNERVAPEARREQVFTERVANAAANKAAETTTGAQAESMKTAAAESGGSTPPPKFTEPPKETAGGPDPGPLATDFGREVGGPIYSFWNYVSSIPAKARAIKEWAVQHQIFLDTQIDTAANEMQMMNKMKELKNKFSWNTIRDAHDLLAHLRETDQVLEYDPLRRITFLKDGVQTYLNPEMSRAVEGVTDYYKEAMRMGVKTFKKHLNEFDEEKLNENSSMENIKRVLDGFKEKIEGNPFPEQKKYYSERQAGIEQIYNRIREFEDNLNPNAPYVPFMRFGDYMVAVKNKKTGKLVHFQPLNRYNKLGSRARLPSEKEARQKIAELGLYNKYNSNDFTISHFKANYNEITKHINKNHISTELIQGLVASGLNSNLHTADHLATDIASSDSFLASLREDVKNNRTRVLKYVASRGIGRFSIKSENIPGYDKDWSMVMDSYRGIWASSLAKQGHAMKSVKAQADLLQAQVPNHLIKDIQNYVDYVNSPDSDMALLRSASFFWTMGFNPSSALLQLATLPNQAMAHMLENSPHLLHNMGIMGTNFRKAVQYVRGKRGVFDANEEHLFENEAYHFRASIRHEADESFAIQNSVSASKFDKGADFLMGKAGMMIGATERLTRISTYSSLKQLYKSQPEALAQFMENRKRDQNWQQFWENQKGKHDLETAAALYGMTLTHGVFGKSGRGELQRGLMGSLFLPFSTYAQQMLEVMGDQLSGQQGINGRMAGLYGMGAFVMMAGMAGIPAYELYKTLYEQYQKNVNGRSVDLEMQLKEAGMPQWLQYGLLSSTFGVDVSKRLGQNVIGEQLLVGALKGDFKASDLGGVPGRVMGNTLGEAAKMLSGDGHTDVMDVISALMPGGLQNVTKAANLAVNPEQAVQTKSGQLAMNPKDVGVGDILGQAAGFTPLALSEGRKAIYWDSLARQEWNQWRSRLAEGTANAQFMIHTGNKNGDLEMVREGQELKRQLHKQMVQNARNNKIPLDGNFWTSFNTAVQDRLWKKTNPGKIRKPTKGEKEHLNVLTTDKNGNY